ncbi:MAG: hypothetical protein J6W41_02350 [Alphaproteobacteria bacterium]|nr:hypothetical protein [Alphaproteobacteria bacterium]
MKKTVSYNIKKVLAGTMLVALPFAFGGCEKDPVKPDNKKHNVELVYGGVPATTWQHIEMDTLYKYNSDPTVDSILMIPQISNQFSTLSTNGLKNLVNLLRERHNVNPNKVFGKGELQLKNESTINNPEIVRFFRDTLGYNVTHR